MWKRRRRALRPAVPPLVSIGFPFCQQGLRRKNGRRPPRFLPTSPPPLRFLCLKLICDGQPSSSSKKSKGRHASRVSDSSTAVAAKKKKKAKLTKQVTTLKAELAYRKAAHAAELERCTSELKLELSQLREEEQKSQAKSRVDTAELELKLELSQLREEEEEQKSQAKSRVDTAELEKLRGEAEDSKLQLQKERAQKLEHVHEFQGKLQTQKTKYKEHLRERANTGSRIQAAEKVCLVPVSCALICLQRARKRQHSPGLGVCAPAQLRNLSAPSFSQNRSQLLEERLEKKQQQLDAMKEKAELAEKAHAAKLSEQKERYDTRLKDERARLETTREKQKKQQAERQAASMATRRTHATQVNSITTALSALQNHLRVRLCVLCTLQLHPSFLPSAHLIRVVSLWESSYPSEPCV